MYKNENRNKGDIIKFPLHPLGNFRSTKYDFGLLLNAQTKLHDCIVITKWMWVMCLQNYLRLGYR